MVTLARKGGSIAALLLLCLGGNCSAIAEGDKLKALEFGDILTFEQTLPTKLVWSYDGNELRALFQPDNLDHPSTKCFPVTEQEATSGPKRPCDLSAHRSRDGSKIARRFAASWFIEYADGSTSKHAVTQLDALGSIYPGIDPIWSRENRYFASFDVFAPAQGTHDWQPTERDGVRIVDISAELDKKQKSISRISVIDTGDPSSSVVEQLVEGPIIGADWGADGTLYFVRYRTIDYEDSEPSTVLFSWSIGDVKPRELLRVPGRMNTMYPVVSPDGDQIALAFDTDTKIWRDFLSLMVFDLRDDAVSRLTKKHYIAGRYEWDRNGNCLYYTARNGGFASVRRACLNGNDEVIRQDELRHFNLSMSPDRRFLSYETENGYGQRTVRVLNLESGAETILYASQDFRKLFNLGSFSQIEFSARDGLQLNAFLIKPPDFEATLTYPMIVDVHGGGPGSRLYLQAPFTIGTRPGPLEWHAWAAMGFVVLVPDYRSTGTYGPEQAIERYSEVDFSGVNADSRDILDATQSLFDHDFIDINRIGILGHSAGGARASVILARSDLFNAAVLNEATTAGPYETFLSQITGERTGSSFENFLGPMLGGRLSDRSNEYARTYLLELHQIETPTLILTGGSTPKRAVPSLTSEATFSILRQYDVPTRLVRFVDQGHVYSDPNSARLAFHMASDWFQYWLWDKGVSDPTNPDRYAR